MATKRIFDLVVSLVLVTVTLPLSVVIVAGIVLASPGPIFYRGVRTGRHGRPFRIFKFRTMVVDAERRGGGTSGLDDPRVYGFGRILRRLKLDELPQLLNVLCGEMSLVGPRPELPVYTKRFTTEEQAILTVPPGMTDYSSIRFSSLDEIVGVENVDRIFEEQVLPEKNRLRLQYVRQRSFWVDLKILALTVVCLVRKVFR